MTDLLARCAELVEIPSVSHNEKAIADRVAAELTDVPWLEMVRIEDNIVARTSLGREQRLILAGHLDTVPPNGNERARIEGDVLWGLGSADMKGGVTVMLELARAVAEPSIDLTYVFYVCEEVQQKFNGLVRLLAERPDLLAGDAAVLCEPTGGHVEAGCQGSLHATITTKGVRAHSARPWTGKNAIHRLGAVLERLAGYDGRRPVLDGCEFRESLQAVKAEGFVAYNVVPDEAVLTVNHRFAPDRDVAAALAAVEAVVGPALEAGDRVELLDSSAPAPPSLDHPLLQRLVTSTGRPPRAKLGWTDVSFFAAEGIPATNFGPGDPLLAHSAGECVERSELDAAYSALEALVS